MALVKINGRTHYFDCRELEITKVSSGRYEVTFDGRTFSVIGGRESGGAKNEWFCHYPLMYGEQWLPAKSMVEAIRLGVVY